MEREKAMNRTIHLIIEKPKANGAVIDTGLSWHAADCPMCGIQAGMGTCEKCRKLAAVLVDMAECVRNVFAPESEEMNANPTRETL
jgi:predicted RNA-binding Zn-ribbon protein involved in translation (DUF1610 family)